MAGPEGRLIGGSGRRLRLLPLLSALSFAALAVAMGVGYEREAGLLEYCNHIGFGASCLARATLLANLAVVWAIAAIAVLVLMAIEGLLGRWSRRLHVPPLALLVYAAFLVGLGAAALVGTQAESYGQIPRGTVAALFYTYLTGALFLFTLTFLDYRRRADAMSKSVIVASVAHGIIGMIMAAVFAFFVLFPPQIAT